MVFIHKTADGVLVFIHKTADGQFLGAQNKRGYFPRTLLSIYRILTEITGVVVVAIIQGLVVEAPVIALHPWLLLETAAKPQFFEQYTSAAGNR